MNKTQARMLALQRTLTVMSESLYHGARPSLWDSAFDTFNADDQARIRAAFEDIMADLSAEQRKMERIINRPKPQFKKGQAVYVAGNELLQRIQRARAEYTENGIASPAPGSTWVVVTRKWTQHRHAYDYTIRPRDLEGPRYYWVLSGIAEDDLVPAG